MTSRVELPTEFFDITSSMMLRQPEPEYLFAKMLFAGATRAELMQTDAEAVLARGDRGAPRSGASVAPFSDHQLAIAQTIWSQAFAVVPELGQAGIGHTIKINRPVFTSTTYTEASRRIAAAAAISTTAIPISGEQVSITIQRYAGPYSSTASAVAPYSINRLDAKRAVHNLVELHGVHLARDRYKFVDYVLNAKLDVAPSAQIIRAGNLAADSAFPATGEQPLDLETLFRAEQALKDAYIPRFPDGSYLCVVTPRQMRQLKLDPDFRGLAVFQSNQNPLEIATVAKVGAGITLTESSTLTVDTSTVSGAYIQHGLMFGPGAVGYGIDESVRVAYANEDNYGEDAKCVWIAYEGYETLDNRFVAAVRSS